MNQAEQREEAVFEAALQLPADQRSAYLDQTCAGEGDLRRRVEVLLGAFERAGGFMKQPAVPTPERTARFSLPPAERPGDKIGRYKLLEQIGEGGCGVVYVAEQEEPVRRRVALKVIKLGMDTKQVIARFDAERQALALMDHPNIAKVLDASATDTGRPYFVMELVRGIKITDYCDKNHLPPRERLDLFIQVCRAIQHAHQKGVIHRDIKPSNILVTLHDGVPVPKVIDFGIAKATQGRLTDQTVYTAFEQFIGTPAYMSPEQAELSGLDIDTRSDIYSLGVLLYELLTGKTPFDAKELLAAGLDEMRRTIREVEPVKPSTRLTQELVAAPRQSAADSRAENGGALPRRRYGETQELIHALRGDLDWIVMKCLEKDRTRRYETANGLATDINRHLSNEPIVARPPSQLYRFQKSVQRNKLAFGAATAVTAALVIGLGVSTWMYFKEKTARERAVAAEQEQARLRKSAEASYAHANQLYLRAVASGNIQEARFLLHHGDSAGAEKLIQAARSLLAQMEPAQAAATYFDLGDFRGGQGRWKEASLNFSRAVEHDSTQFHHFHELAATLFRSGDTNAYERIRERMLKQFGETTDRRIAERTVKDCLLLPWNTANVHKLNMLADFAVNGDSNHWALAYFWFAKGLVEYRQGHFDNAVDWMQKVISDSTHNVDFNRQTQAYMVLAMAYHQLGRSTEARAAFAEGFNMLSNSLPQNDTELINWGWNGWVFAKAFATEAMELIDGTLP